MDKWYAEPTAEQLADLEQLLPDLLDVDLERVVAELNETSSFLRFIQTALSLGLVQTNLSNPAFTAAEEHDLLILAQQGSTQDRQKLVQATIGLTTKEEAQHKLQEEAMEARQTLIKTNIVLVAKIVWKYRELEPSLSVFLQEGMLCLEQAVDKFPLDRGFRLTPYATWWILAAIPWTVRKYEEPTYLNISPFFYATLQRLRRAQLRLQEEWGRKPTVQDLAIELSLPANKISEFIEILEQQDEDQRLRLEYGEAKYEEMLQTKILTHLQEFKLKLPEKERQILEWRFGL